MMILKNKLIWILLFLFNYLYINYMIIKINLYWFLGDIYISSYFSFNKLSFLLIIMTLWILMIMYLMKNNYLINIYSTLLTLLLLLIFISKNLILFFFFFEFSLIPIFLMMKKWGNYMERMNASFYLLIYTLFFSFPLLFLLLNLYNSLFSLEYNLLLLFYKMKLNIFEFIFFMMAFLVKMPMFMLHFWLPKAHVEAPVFGSMFLASIMLKLGSFGLFRIMNMFKFNDKNFILSISLMGMLLISLNCLRMIDMKILVAYSSVIHMNMMIASMFTYSMTSFFGSYMMMIAHGLISSAMFFLINEFYYMSKSRLFKFNKGILNLIPSMQFLWFLLCTSNMSVPLSLNFISEMFMLISLISFMKYLMILFFIIIMLNSFYNLYLYMFISHSLKNNKLKIINFKINNMFIIMLHWLPINLMFLKMNLFFM